MKCKKIYEMYCRSYQVAKSESGNWFHRSYVSTSYGYTWTKWKPLGHIESITRTTLSYENRNGNEINEKSIIVEFVSDHTERVYIKTNTDCYRNSKCRLPY